MRVEVGDALPGWTMERVSAERMKTVAALLRDPNPVHWDRTAVAALGLGDHVINQSPVNLGYVINMLIAWAGPGSVRRLTVRFPLPVRDGDTVTASGVVTAVTAEGDTRLAECEVWLDRQDGSRSVEGVAVVALSS